MPASSDALKGSIASGKPGNEVILTVGRRTGRFDFRIIAGTNKQKSWAITPLSQPDPLQAKILNNWLTN
jgi:hypothetical protein